MFLFFFSVQNAVFGRQYWKTYPFSQDWTVSLHESLCLFISMRNYFSFLMICFCFAFYWGAEKGFMVLIQQNISCAVRGVRLSWSRFGDDMGYQLILVCTFATNNLNFPRAAVRQLLASLKLWKHINKSKYEIWSNMSLLHLTWYFLKPYLPEILTFSTIIITFKNINPK